MVAKEHRTLQGANEACPVAVSLRGDIAVLTFERAAKRNAINDAMADGLRAFFTNPPKDVRAVVIAGSGGHFSAGLDLGEQSEREPVEVLRHSRRWHDLMDMIQFGGLPVVAALTGSVIGGGLEIAASCHVRVAEPSAMYQLPEGRHGIFVGGGASVRVARIIGQGRMCEMMLTGRIYKAEDGQQLGLSHYLVEEGAGMAKAQELALRIAENTPMANYAMVTAIQRISNMSTDDGFYVESLAAGLTQTSPEIAARIGSFLKGKRG